MDRRDFEILEELLDVVEQLQQRTGGNPRRSYLSSSRKLRQDTDDFAGKCQRGELVGRARNASPASCSAGSSPCVLTFGDGDED